MKITEILRRSLRGLKNTNKMRLSFTCVLWVFTLCAQTTCACNNCYLIQVEDSPVALQWVWFVYVDTCTDNARTARFAEATVKSHWQHPQSLQNTTCYRLKGSNLSLSFFICIHTTQCMLSFSFCVCVCAPCVWVITAVRSSSKPGMKRRQAAWPNTVLAEPSLATPDYCC